LGSHLSIQRSLTSFEQLSQSSQTQDFPSQQTVFWAIHYIDSLPFQHNRVHLRLL
jgi:hypothetical protein